MAKITWEYISEGEEKNIEKEAASHYLCKCQRYLVAKVGEVGL